MKSLFTHLQTFRFWTKDYYRVASSSGFVRKVSQTFLARVAQLGLTMAASILVTRTLGPAGRGTYAAALALSNIGLQLGNLGLHASNTYEVARNKIRLPTLLGNSLFACFGFGGVLSLAAWFVLSRNPEWFHVQGVLLIMALIWIPIALAYMLLQNLLLGLDEIGFYNSIETWIKVLGLAMILLALAVLGFKKTSVEAFFLVSLATVTAGFFLCGAKLFQLSGKRLKVSLGLFGENIRYGFKAYLASVFSYLVLRIDVLMVQNMRGPVETGYYSVAAGMGEYVSLFPIIVGTILFPKLSSMPSGTHKWVNTKKAALGVAGLMVILTLLAALLAPLGIRLLYGPAYLPAVQPFVWLMPGIFMLSVNVIFMNYFASIGMPLVTVYSPLIAALLNVVVNLKFIPQYGIVGASWASTLCYGTMLFFSFLYILFFKPKEGSV